MTPHRLSEPESDQAIAALARVARHIDPFDFVPAPGRSARVVTAGPFHLAPAEYTALGDVVGASSVALANIAVDGSLFRAGIWKVSTAEYPFERLKSDRAWNGIGSSALRSPDGVWVVVVSDEGHGVLVGPSAFVTELQSRLPHHAEGLREIAARLYVGTEEARDADERLIRMLGRLYGEDETQRAVAGLGWCRSRDAGP